MLPAGAAAAAVHPVQQSVIALLEKVVSLRLLFLCLCWSCAESLQFCSIMRICWQRR